MTIEPTWFGEDTSLEILSLERADNDTTVLKFQLTNNRDEEISTYFALADGTPTSQTVEGVSLIDVGARKQYFPLRYGESESPGQPQPCYCSTFAEFGDKRRIKPGETQEFWAGYPALPDGVDTVSVHTPVTGTVHDIPITGGGAPPEPLPDDHDDPIVVDLVAAREDLEEGSTREETGEQVSVSLSADVLFDVDESTLRPDAEQALREVAEEIAESDAETVQIDGHTDNSGTDTINQPLSEDRAEAVKDELDTLITRSGISYETAGHGSDEPVADNRTDEGKQKNRRVTITYDAAPAAEEMPEPASREQESASPDASRPAGSGPAQIVPGKENRYFKELSVEVEAVRRSSHGGLASLRYRVVNHADDESTVLGGSFGSPAICGSLPDARLNGVMLIDEQAQVQYPVLQRSDSHCLAPRGAGETVPAHESRTLWIDFWLDPSVTEVTVQVPKFEAVTGVPVT
ncbi:outer membrane protein OmpA-like peptidoglycan-associated protein [Nocardiopsis mwathae]|uniref:Outer membrane protein OmpA-like peptidoglycan-associated protein n=1 Tax=Nocardiopsis mwathae TaxID=1472723 RepID=A0A7X0D4D4_9ACTN|nr:OmpA family protein [Nocardiopsis mwathae]MBB6170646.1 outer membrane protein OmpA-like peptidoglycan-associated protein [Nocardiopsis mwathae]